jgi:hypothetical protein
MSDELQRGKRAADSVPYGADDLFSSVAACVSSLRVGSSDLVAVKAAMFNGSTIEVSAVNPPIDVAAMKPSHSQASDVDLSARQASCVDCDETLVSKRKPKKTPVDMISEGIMDLCSGDSTHLARAFKYYRENPQQFLTVFEYGNPKQFVLSSTFSKLVEKMDKDPKVEELVCQSIGKIGGVPHRNQSIWVQVVDNDGERPYGGYDNMFFQRFMFANICRQKMLNLVKPDNGTKVSEFFKTYFNSHINAGISLPYFKSTRFNFSHIFNVKFFLEILKNYDDGEVARLLIKMHSDHYDSEVFENAVCAIDKMNWGETEIKYKEVLAMEKLCHILNEIGNLGIEPEAFESFMRDIRKTLFSKFGISFFSVKCIDDAGARADAFHKTKAILDIIASKLQNKQIANQIIADIVIMIVMSIGKVKNRSSGKFIAFEEFVKKNPIDDAFLLEIFKSVKPRCFRYGGWGAIRTIVHSLEPIKEKMLKKLRATRDGEPCKAQDGFLDENSLGIFAKTLAYPVNNCDSLCNKEEALRLGNQMLGALFERANNLTFDQIEGVLRVTCAGLFGVNRVNGVKVPPLEILLPPFSMFHILPLCLDLFVKHGQDIFASENPNLIANFNAVLGCFLNRRVEDVALPDFLLLCEKTKGDNRYAAYIPEIHKMHEFLSKFYGSLPCLCEEIKDWAMNDLI